jgi:ABC-type Fe3+ transport system permease subunit
VTWFHIRRLLKPFDLQTLLFVFVFITVLLLVLYPIILIVMNSFQSAPPGRPRVLALDGWRAALSEPGMRGSIYITLTLLLTRQGSPFPSPFWCQFHCRRARH